MYNLGKSIIFRFNPEFAHELGMKAIKTISFLKKPKSFSNLETTLFSDKKMTPVFLAAGFDKYAEVYNQVKALNLSVPELGTFTKTMQEGNPKPRLFRLVKDKSIINRMGFNNAGINAALLELENHPPKEAIAISIGKSKETEVESAIDDYLEIINKINSADGSIARNIEYLAINISSPNTPNLRKLQEGGYLKSLLEEIKTNSRYPVVVKFAPDFDDRKSFQKSIEIALNANVDGIIVNNTSSDFSQVKYTHLSETILKGGGLSGEAIQDLAAKRFQEAMEVIKDKIPVIASGGIMSPQNAWSRFLLGAKAIQVFTGFIYNGPFFAQSILSFIDKKLQQYELKNIDEFYKVYRDIYEEENK